MLLLEHASNNGIFDPIDHDLVFGNASTNKIKMNHIKTMLCGNFVGIDKLERLKLLQSDPLVNEFAISIKEPETVSRFSGNRCYNIQLAFCDEFKSYLTGYVRSGDTYTANGTAEKIKEIVAQLKDEGLEITFRIDSGYFDDAILETIESLGGKYVIKGKRYPTLVAQVTDPSITFVTCESGRETTELVTALNTWEKGRRFVVSRVLKDEKDRAQISFLE